MSEFDKMNKAVPVQLLADMMLRDVQNALTPKECKTRAKQHARAIRAGFEALLTEADRRPRSER